VNSAGDITDLYECGCEFLTHNARCFFSAAAGSFVTEKAQKSCDFSAAAAAGVAHNGENLSGRARRVHIYLMLAGSSTRLVCDVAVMRG
jgi:hypothetical protein